MTKFGRDLIEGAREALAIARGEAEPARVVLPERIDVAAIRKRVGASQEEFAKRFGLSLAMVRDWEQKRRNPDRAARTLLLVIESNPEAVERALNAA
jgi:putative transcriptional regulator